jgi:ubiquinone biosynthesis UbiH/UbiF/VisC/COQ6 family hydroxylase
MPRMKISSDIVVIGSGAIGKAAALALAQAGLDVVLVAPTPPSDTAHLSPDWDQRVYALNHVAHALLSSLKVWHAMDATRIAPVDAMAVHGDGASEGDATFNHAPGHLAFDAYGARVDALAWIVEDQNLNHALDAALRFASNLRIVQGTAARMQCEAERAVVTLDSGDTIESSLIVGADGAQSWVRTQADIGMDYRAYGQTAVVANFSVTQPHHGVARQWFLGSDGIVALLPLPGQRVSLVWSAPEPLAASLLRASPPDLCERLQALPGQSLGALSMLAPHTARGFPLRLMRSHALVAHRLALIGDAAHVVHPLAGQGMNLGFADIDALLAALDKRESKADCGDARTLARYARSRKEEVLLMQFATDGLQRLFASELGPVKALRNLGMTAIDKLPFLKRRLMNHAFGRSLSSTVTGS